MATAFRAMGDTQAIARSNAVTTPQQAEAQNNTQRSPQFSHEGFERSDTQPIGRSKSWVSTICFTSELVNDARARHSTK